MIRNMLMNTNPTNFIIFNYNKFIFKYINIL